jgi:hypothetical protein
LAAAAEGFINDHAAAAAGACRAIVDCRSTHVADLSLRSGVDRRQGRGDQFFGASDISLAGGSGEQSVVTDAMFAKIAIAIVQNRP